MADQFITASAVDAARQKMVQREGSRTSQDDEERHSNHEKVIFETFSPLVTEPVHEEAELIVNGGDRDDHVYSDSKSCNPSEKADEQSHAAKELCANGQEREGRWNMHHACEESHRGGKSAASKPAESLLAAMREEDQS